MGHPKRSRYQKGDIGLRTGRPRSAKPPTPQKCSGECSERCRPETGCLGMCSEKCLPLVSLRGTRRTSTFLSTSPSTPFLAGTSPSTLPSTFGGLGVLRFCRGPPRSQTSATSIPQKGHLDTKIVPQGNKSTHKQICGIVPGLGGCQNFVYVFFSGHSLWGRKTHKQSPPKNNLGESHDIFVYVFFLYVFFFALTGSIYHVCVFPCLTVLGGPNRPKCLEKTARKMSLSRPCLRAPNARKD